MKSTNILSSLKQASMILDQEYPRIGEVEQDEDSVCWSLRMKIDTLTMLTPASILQPRKVSIMNSLAPMTVYEGIRRKRCLSRG
jgi:hypothetical protein